MEAVELYHLLTLDEQSDMETGFQEGLKAGQCHILQKASDVPDSYDEAPGGDKKPLAKELAARIAPPSCRAIEGGFEVVLCVWYDLGGILLRRTMMFRGGAIEVQTEKLAEGVGACKFKQ